MQVRSANRGACHLDNGIVRVQDRWIRHRQGLKLAFSHPANSFHYILLRYCLARLLRAVGKSDLLAISRGFSAAHDAPGTVWLALRSRYLAGFRQRFEVS